MPHLSPYAGSWYPESGAELERMLDDLFDESRGRTPHLYPDGPGYVVPHAGPSYSGAAAAAVYRSLERQQPERVVVLAFPHRGGLRGVAAPDIDSVVTPLGASAIDADFGAFPKAPESRLCDHSFEIQLPFLQRAAPKARITPLYVGPMDAEDRESAAAALAALWRPGVVFLASSDFTHFGRSFGFTPFPPGRGAEERIRELDFDCIEAAAALDPERFLKALQASGATVCGTDPIALLLDTLRRIDAEIYQATLDYRTSGETTGDFHNSVSYAALGWYRPASFLLDGGDQGALLESASRTFGELRRTGEARPFPAAGESTALQARRGLFVSLRQGDELLGCVGNVSGRHALAEDVADLTLAAALEDPRFRPASRAEGPVDIEISVLTPFRGIRSAGQCRVGAHGLYLRHGARAGLLLPQVASERGWTTEEFLAAVARKSLLGPGAWRDPKAKLQVFEAQIFARHGCE